MRRISLIMIAAGWVCLAGWAPARGADKIEELKKELTRTARSGNVSDRYDREKAVKKLGRMNTYESTVLLVDCLGDPLAQIRNVAIKALGGVKRSREKDKAVDYILKKGLFDSRNEDRRFGAAKALGIIGDERASKSLQRVYKSDRASRVKAAAAEALGLLGDPAVAKLLLRELFRSSEAAGASALAIGRLGASDRADDLRKAALTGKHWSARAYGVDGLKLLKSSHLGGVCEDRLGRDRDFRPRVAVCDALGDLASLSGEKAGPVFALGLLKKALDDKAWQVRVAAVEAAVDLWNPECVELLVQYLSEVEGSRLLVDVVKALTFYVGKDLGFFRESWQGWWKTNKEGYALPRRPRKGRWGRYEQDRGAGKGKKEATQASFFSMPIFSKSYAFLFDFSGSMENGSLGRDRGRAKIDIAKEQFVRCAEKLNKASRFNLYIYREEFKWPVKVYMETFQRDLVLAAPFNRQLAIRWIHAAEVKGRGPFYDGLSQVTDNAAVDTVYLLADGSPSSGSYVGKYDFIEAWVAENRFKRVMVCPVLIGSSGVNIALMKMLAEVTSGFYVHYKGE